MKTNETYKLFLEQQELINAYEQLIQTAQFDKMTIAPEKGQATAAKRIALVSGEYFKILTSKEYLELVNELYKERAELDPAQQRIIELTHKELNRLKNIPEEEYVAYVNLCGDSEIAWQKAKKASDYSIFEPYLKKVIEFQKRFAYYRDPKSLPYNLFLDDFEEGMTIEKYDQFFTKIKTELVPLIKKVATKSGMFDTTKVTNGSFSIEKQTKVMELLKDYLEFDQSWGYMATSAHPFTSGFNNDDIRITTAYDKNNLASAIFSIIHEIGHATLEHHVAERYDGTAIKSDITSAIHESQSRLFENNLGRSFAFWQFNFPKIKEIFKEELEEVSPTQFHQIINFSKPSFIRTEADELTYPIHILIRYEIEKGIFDGSIELDQLRDVWNQKYFDHLGIEVTEDAQGILQDIHWSDGSFGYFPTYALGSAYSAQIINTMKQNLDLDALLANGDFHKINNWLKENIHQYGARYTPDQWLKKITGEAFNPDYYINYLKEKYTTLYDL